MDYAKEIKEELSFLQIQERKAVKAIIRDRIRFLRFLKSGQARSQRQAGELIGVGVRQSQKLWHRYTHHGFDAFIKTGHKPGFGKLSSYQLSHLQAYLRQDQVSTLEEACAYVRSTFNVEYTISGVGKLFQRMQIRNKTARPLNIRRQEDEAADFKKTLNS